MKSVRLYIGSLADERSINSRRGSTDKQGWASIGSLKPSETKYVIATSSEDYGFAKLAIKLDDPETVVSRQIVLRKGAEVKGTVLCADGKPPAGWKIYAVPTWWNFGTWPHGQVIGPDGSFTLPHVVPDKYDVKILVPVGTASTPKKLLTAVMLPRAEGPLSLTLDYPSPGSMASISGKIRYVGGKLGVGFWIFADSEDRQYHGSEYVMPGKDEFHIGPVPHGVYTVKFESKEFESIILRGIKPPAEDLEIEIVVKGTPVLRGTVVRGDTGKPVTDFRLKVTKLSTLSGPNFVQQPLWHEFNTEGGKFEGDVVGPGIYVVQATADGGGWATSEPFNTDEDGDKELRLELHQGISLSGTVVDDDDGYYEIHHLPEELCYVRRADESNSLGVVRQAILPENGATQTLDFGGRAKLEGRLTVNGAPLANTKLQFTGKNPRFGIFRAYARTGGDGSFIFWGVEPGERTLYYAVKGRRDDWVRVEDLKVTSEATDLGSMDHVEGRVVVECEPAAANLRVVLQEYDPIWPHGNSVGVSAPHEKPGDPFVFDHVPPGKYGLVARVPDGFSVRQVVETTRADLNHKLKLALPSGTASLSGKLDETICGPAGHQSLNFWSKDGRLHAQIIPKDGAYRLDAIPAGDYLIASQDVRDPQALLELTVRAGEEKTLDITPDVVSPLPRPGFLVVRIFTPAGVPLPGCDVHLDGPGGRLSPHSSQRARLAFVGDAGTYELSASYPSFRPIRRTVKLMQVAKGGAAAKGSEVRLRLEPSSPSK